MDSHFPETRPPSCIMTPEGGSATSFGRLLIPGRIGPYRRISYLGEGGMGEVHLAEDLRSGRIVALKFSRFGPDVRNQEGLERFKREALAAGRFDHPGLCPIHDAGQVGGLYYLAMDYIDGTPLANAIKERPGLPEQGGAARLIHLAALAVGEAHAQGVIHRDLKPSNIIIRHADGVPVVIDFGLAWWFIDGESRLTRTGTILGTPYYMSPEQVNGDVKAMGPGCDIYSLGVVLYELLTGRLPFEGSVASVLGKILFKEPTPPSTYRPGLNPRLEHICRTAMAKEIGSRYATMAEMAAELGAIEF